MASPVGRCRTLPAPDASPTGVSFGVASCNSYNSGYFGGFGRIAEEDVDFLLHVGDFIYEGGGDSRLEGRSFRPPSGNRKAHTLADYRFIHRTYRSDERLYRSGPPEDRFGRRESSRPPSEAADDPDRTMLGESQLDWFLNGGRNPDSLPDTEGVEESDALWTLWGNSVMYAAMKQLPAGPATWYNSIARATYDAWDGYRHERSKVNEALAATDNVVVFTGDFHTYLAAYLKADYEDLAEYEYYSSSGTLPSGADEEAINRVVQAGNPHIEWFNSSTWGYATVEITREDCTYTAYNVDRKENTADAPKELLRRYRVPEGRVELEAVARTPTNRVVGDVEGVTSEVGLPDIAKRERE